MAKIWFKSCAAKHALNSTAMPRLSKADFRARMASMALAVTQINPQQQASSSIEQQQQQHQRTSTNSEQQQQQQQWTSNSNEQLQEQQRGSSSMKRIRLENDGEPFDNGEHGEQPPHVHNDPRWHDCSAMDWQAWCSNAWGILRTAPPDILAAAAAMSDEDAPPATSATAAADMADEDAE